MLSEHEASLARFQRSRSIPTLSDADIRDLPPDTFPCDPRPISPSGYLWYKVLVNIDNFIYTARADRRC